MSLAQDSISVEGGSYNVISWVTHDDPKPWKLQFCFNQNKVLVSHPSGPLSCG